ncbi:MAG: PD40 domain-containing protein [Phycisphaeraceae bacterium]|nr:PD40 domain-containing protein [Phycisphaeraceae bacterium]
MMRLVAWALGLGLAIAGIVALVILAGAGRVGAGRVLTNDLDVQIDAGGVERRMTVWTEARALDGAPASDTHVFDPTTDARGTVMIVARGRTGGGVDLYESRWDGSAWGVPVALDALNSDADDLGACLSADGRTVIFASDRGALDGRDGGFDLWMSERGEPGWGEPRRLEGVNTVFDEYDPALSPDGATLLFASNRPRGDVAGSAPDRWNATIRERSATGDFDLFVSSVRDGVIGETRRLDEANTEHDEGTPAFSPMGDFLYFASNREGAGGFDLYRMRLTRDGFERAESVGSPVNTVFNEMDPALIAGGFGLIFSSDRSGEIVAESGGARFGLYASESREVYSERTPIDWAGLWGMVWPWLLGLLALLALLWLLRMLGRLSRDERLARAWRRLSLLAKCIMLSLLLHALLLMLLAAWQVKTALEAYFREPGEGVRVVIAGESGGSEAFFAQLRGGADEPVVAPAVSAAAPVMAASMDAPISEAIERERPVIEASADHEAMETPHSVAERARVEPESAAPAEMSMPEVATPAAAQSEAMAEASDAPVTERMPVGVMRIDAPSLADAPASDVPRAALDAISLREEAGIEVAPAREVGTVTDEREAMPGVALEAGGVADGVSVPSAGAASASAESEEPSLTARESLSTGVAVPGMGAVDVNPVERASAELSAHDESVIEVAPAMGARLRNLETDAMAGPGVERMAMDVTLPAAEGAENARGEQPALDAFAPAGDGRTQSAHAAAPALTAMDGGAPIERPALRADAGRGDAIGLHETPVADRHAEIAIEMPALDTGLMALSLPRAEDEPEEVYPQRAPEAREELVEAGGGSAETEEAVARALGWLARHQHADGRWSSRGFDDGCGACGNAARYEFDPATTGLALLCFFGTDHGVAGRETEYSDAVRRGVAWLVAQQGNDGDLRGGGTMYTHGIATIALCEAYALSRDEALLAPIGKAVRFIERAGSAGNGWRYEPGQAGDTSVLGWQVMALESARRCGVAVDPAAIESARAWLDEVSTRRARGVYAYQRGMAPTMSMTAEGMFVRQLLGAGRHEARQEESARFVVRELPDWDADANTYGWYYATLALYQHGGDNWERWNAALVRELLGAQRDDGAAAGSWDPADQWSDIGGRVYQTALCTLSLEVYYRYLPMYVGDAGAQETVNDVRGGE